jgi:transcription initiation factor TFIID TATA-box-binding protein
MVIIHRTTPTPAAVMLFPNGTLMCTGIKTMQDAEDIIRTTTKILNTAGVPTRENPEMKIQTLVTSQDLHKKLDLQSIAKTLGTNKTEYDPKQFPGLIYKKEGNNTVVLLFDSGKMVCTGTNSDDISHALEQLTNELSSCKMI